MRVALSCAFEQIHFVVFRSLRAVQIPLIPCAGFVVFLCYKF